MSEPKVSQFAAELKMPTQELLQQLKAAGVNKNSADDVLSSDDKQRLLGHLKQKHGQAGDKPKVTLARKETTEIRKTDATGKSKTIQVEVRKKRVFEAPEAPVARVVEPAVVAPVAPAAPVVAAPQAPAAPTLVIDESQRLTREAESRRQNELYARQAAEMAAKKNREQKPVEVVAPVVEAAPVAAVESVAPAAQASAPAKQPQQQQAKPQQHAQQAKPQQANKPAEAAKPAVKPHLKPGHEAPRVGARVDFRRPKETPIHAPDKAAAP
ncbi:MAG: translation initiation factor IF-2 associated domain-containing protein, partial [Deefgea sp.]